MPNTTPKPYNSASMRRFSFRFGLTRYKTRYPSPALLSVPASIVPNVIGIVKIQLRQQYRWITAWNKPHACRNDLLSIGIPRQQQLHGLSASKGKNGVVDKRENKDENADFFSMLVCGMPYVVLVVAFAFFPLAKCLNVRFLFVPDKFLRQENIQQHTAGNRKNNLNSQNLYNQSRSCAAGNQNRQHLVGSGEKNGHQRAERNNACCIEVGAATEKPHCGISPSNPPATGP